jgi:predicted phage terminase large subunit-like protein
MITVKDLIKKRQFLFENDSEDTWYMEYQNEPRNQEKSIFKKEWLKYYEPEDIDIKKLDIYTGIDLAFSTSKIADYTAIITIGIDSSNFIYILDIVNKRMPITETIDTLFEVYLKWKPIMMTIQKDILLRGIKPILEDIQRRKNLYLPFMEINYAGYHGSTFKKENRIEANLSKRFQWGSILIGKGMSDLIDQYLTFPGKHDDVLDALNDVIQYASPPDTEKYQKVYTNRVRIEDEKDTEKGVYYDSELGRIDWELVNI